MKECYGVGRIRRELEGEMVKGGAPFGAPSCVALTSNDWKLALAKRNLE